MSGSAKKPPTAEDFLEQALAAIPEEERIHRFRIFRPDDIGAPAASGSAPFHGMVVVPCSMKSLSAIAHGHASNLMERAADVTLKERRRLILVVRESPYSLIHLRNMTSVTEAGGIILPASPGFYNRPQTPEEMGDFVAGRILSLLGMGHDLAPEWRGDSPV